MSDRNEEKETNISAETPHTSYEAQWWRCNDLGLSPRSNWAEHELFSVQSILEKPETISVRQIKLEMQLEIIILKTNFFKMT